MRLRDKVVIVTGATKGVGRGLAVAIGGEGAKVVLGGRNEAEGAAVAAEVAAGPGEALFVKGELTVPSQCDALVHAAVDRFGRLDGLVNYAGSGDAVSPFPDVPEEEFDRIMAVNFKSAFFVTQAAVRAMADRGGSIVFMGSLHAYDGQIDRPAYACSKGAMLTLFRHVAKNYADKGIRSNWITVGWVATPGERELRGGMGFGDGWEEAIGRDIMPMGRLQRPDDYVDAVLYLLGDGASQTTGSELRVTGGLSL